MSFQLRARSNTFAQNQRAMIQLYLKQYHLLSSLPQEFNITEVDVYTDVTITLENTDIYTTRLYEVGGKATFYGFRDIIRDSMLASGHTLASLTVRAVGIDTFTYTGKYILFADSKFIADNDIIWQQFLTTRSTHLIPLECDFPLYFFSDETESVTPYADCTFKADDGRLATYTYTIQHDHQNRPFIYVNYISPLYMQQRIESSEGQSLGKLVSITFHAGPRTLTAYITDETHEVDFFFRGCFNTFEHIFIYGSTTFKTAVSRKEAVSQGVTSFYDNTVDRRYNVETTPLTHAEAEWFNEFLESHYVERYLSEDYQARVLISDITSEISDNPKDTVKLKFSWRYTENSRWI